MAASGQSPAPSIRVLKSDSHIYQVDPSKKSLGTGTFGKVVLARREDDLLVAIKTAHGDNAPDLYRHERELRLELRLQNKLRHPNICQVLDAFESSDGLNDMFYPEQHMVLEYCNGGDLYGIVNRGLPMTWVYDVLAPAIISGLNYLDQVHGWVHNDIKPDNILLKKVAMEFDYSCVKIADFGLAMPVNVTGKIYPSEYQRQVWEPDWIYRNGSLYHTPAVDVFRTGIVLAWVLNVKLPSLNGEGFRSVHDIAPEEWCNERREEIHRDIFNSAEMEPFRCAWAQPTSAEWDADRLSECRAEKILAILRFPGHSLPNFDKRKISTGEEVWQQFRGKLCNLQAYRQSTIWEVADAITKARELREKAQTFRNSCADPGSSELAAQMQSEARSAYEVADALKTKYQTEFANLEEAEAKTNATERQAAALQQAATQADLAVEAREAGGSSGATPKSAVADDGTALSFSRTVRLVKGNDPQKR